MPRTGDDARREYEATKVCLADSESCQMLGPYAVKHYEELIAAFEKTAEWPTGDEEMTFMRASSTIVKVAKELARKDWPSAFPYGSERWVEENYPNYLSRAKQQLKVGEPAHGG